ncbi:MAG: SusD/RagB family nutrient-binding outer membrane lipoprotein [Flavobacteriaceae bacterium]
MKNISKLFTYVLLGVGLVFTSCETTDLDLLDDPNNVTQDKASLDRFMTAIQLDFTSFMRQMGGNGAALTRINYMFGRTYSNNYQPVALNGEWSLAYRGMFSDMASAESLAQSNGDNKHLGVMRILKAYTLITLVDAFGDVPLSQATDPSAYPAPMVDPGADVYAAAIDMLNEGIDYLSQPGDNLEYDFFYNNEFGKWTKLANTVKMVAFLNTGNTSGFNGIVNTGNFINSTDDDFQFQYGTNETNPDTRHPSYNSNYNVTGTGPYQSVWLMGTMLDLGDPRMRYYFYRQSDCCPGASCNPGGSQTTLTCSVAPRPNHFPSDMLFCSLEEGYWGRDHGNAEGIPPDSFQKTSGGVYPIGGSFDDDRFTSVTVGGGGGGAGIVPIMLASWTEFMKAEVALASGSAGAASSALSAGMNKHINKVLEFGSLDPEADSAFFANSSDVSSYISSVVNAFNGGSNEDKWEVLATQQFIAHYGNGMDSYNFYRRTGYPKKLQLNIDPNPGAFVRSFFYPANEANVNSNIVQKPGVDVQVFWDTNPPSPGFPVAN